VHDLHFVESAESENDWVEVEDDEAFGYIADLFPPSGTPCGCELPGPWGATEEWRDREGQVRVYSCD
jgi:hypothetical protein